MAAPNVSIIITCYNYGKYLSGAIDSVLWQTYNDYEIIVIDDGSTDNTAEVIKKYSHLKRFNYIRQVNGGQSKAKNIGIKNAAGKYIAFLDADDMWEKDKLKKQIPFFLSDSVGVVYSRARYIDGDGRDLDYSLSCKYLQPSRGKVTEKLIMDNFIPFSSSVVRRECFERLGFFDESLKMGIDWDLWLRISTLYEFEFIVQPLILCRMGHKGQMSKNKRERQRCSDRIMISFASRYKKYIKKNILRHAWAYTYSNRGAYYLNYSSQEALSYFWRSIIKWPFSLRPFIGILKVIRKKTIEAFN
ncbi:MAG: glycosyltransferase [Desulfobacteraceae bacterium]|nr:glycosyltransferase [Desulfobacteraceae bacterium]